MRRKSWRWPLGAKFFELNVNDIVQNYTHLISQAIDRELTWDHDDLALQNIQARARGPSVLVACEYYRRATLGNKQSLRGGGWICNHGW